MGTSASRTETSDGTTMAAVAAVDVVVAAADDAVADRHRPAGVAVAAAVGVVVAITRSATCPSCCRDDGDDARETNGGRSLGPASARFANPIPAARPEFHEKMDRQFSNLNGGKIKTGTNQLETFLSSQKNLKF